VSEYHPICNVIHQNTQLPAALYREYLKFPYTSKTWSTP